MDGEQNGNTQAQQDAQRQEGNQQTAQQPQQETQQEPGGGASDVDVAAYEAQIAERDARIEELEGQISEAAKNAEAADGLREEIAALRQQGADERVEFTLMLAGCRNVKAAKAVLEDHGGDVDALKAAEPWMFADAPVKQTGKTGLPNAGAAKDDEKQMRHWRDIAGLNDEE